MRGRCKLLSFSLSCTGCKFYWLNEVNKSTYKLCLNKYLVSSFNSKCVLNVASTILICNYVIVTNIQGRLQTSYTKQMIHPQSLRIVRSFTYVYLYARTTRHVWCAWQIMIILIVGKLLYPQFEFRAGIKMAQVVESPLYVCGNSKYWN